MNNKTGERGQNSAELQIIYTDYSLSIRCNITPVSTDCTCDFIQRGQYEKEMRVSKAGKPGK